MSLAPRSSIALVIQWNEMGWFSAALLPMIRITSLFFRSTQWLVMAPRPNVGASAPTVLEWQMRA